MLELTQQQIQVREKENKHTEFGRSTRADNDQGRSGLRRYEIKQTRIFLSNI